MKPLQNFSLIWILLIGVFSCATAPMPETNAERLSYIEISYGVILDKATLYANEGRLSPDQIKKMNNAFDAYELARTAAKLAVMKDDDHDFNNQSALINSILTNIRSILAEVE